VKEKLYRTCIELTNGKVTSYIVKGFSKSRFSKFFVPSFANHFKININESVKSIRDFKSMHDFFIRELKRGIHQIDEQKDTVVSPVDATIEDFGPIHSTTHIIVKGKDYYISEMLGSKDAAKKYLGGSYIVFYLSPSDYHRIHAPLSGKVQRNYTLGRKSYPVNSIGMKYGKAPLSKNYRQITELKAGNVNIAVVKVGAMIINSIEKTYKSETLKKGEEMAYFTFGSTVVLLFEKNTFQMDENIKSPHKIRMGERIGKITSK